MRDPVAKGPFVHKFETDRDKYVYDVNTNRVLRVSDVAYDVLNEPDQGTLRELVRKFPQHDKAQLRRSLREIQAARRRRGLFSSQRPSCMGYAGDDPVSWLSAQPHEQLILSVTERCNMRCRYCAYSGIYPDQRQHRDRDMSFSTAKKAIDRFLGNLAQEPCLSFYGGEPLLRITLIRQIIEYAESRTREKLDYAMTTNGTLLTPAVCEYLREKEIRLLVSLDGPKPVHDRYRVDRKGEGTFDRIAANLKHFRSLDEEYYRKHVGFCVVSAPPHRLEVVDDFFASDPLVRACRVTFSYMAEGHDADFEDSLTEEEQAGAAEQSRHVTEKYLASVREGKPKKGLATTLHEKAFVKFYHRPKTPLGDRLPLNGCCIPGGRRLFAAVDGTLHVCERTDNAYPIGTVDTWIEPERVRKLIDDYAAVGRDCLDCWACRLCTECFSSFAKDGAFDLEHRRAICRSTQARLHNMLRRYYAMLEEDENVWDHLQDIEFA